MADKPIRLPSEEEIDASAVAACGLTVSDVAKLICRISLTDDERAALIRAHETGMFGGDIATLRPSLFRGNDG